MRVKKKILRPALSNNNKGANCSFSFFQWPPPPPPPSFPPSRVLGPASPPPSAARPSIFTGATDAVPPPEDEDSSDDDAEDAGASPRRSGRKDRRRAVRIAWEKLVRWSRSWRRRNRSDVLGDHAQGSFGTAMAAHVAAKKADLEVAMLLRDDLVCRSINNTHIN
ncbi:glycerol-3-phosphate dehydrogenase [NAD(+)], chloroplastic-like [Miscanthus floridulus]|uniref:glycerol-3-phosphate dehydrogenase [NAD(+)], chloroplastic-like n=1 Tax=Miscanthus floridulus TaxID=154761 RepID=UPI0034588C65